MQRFDVEALITMSRQNRVRRAVGTYEFGDETAIWGTSTASVKTLSATPRESDQVLTVWRGNVSLSAGRAAGHGAYEASFPIPINAPRVEIIQGGIPNRDLANKLNVLSANVMTRVVSGGSATSDSAPTWDAVETEDLIRSVRGDPLIANSNKIADRLMELYRLDEDDLGGGSALDVRSLRLFVASLRTMRPRRIPTLSLSPSGYVYASWRLGENLFSVHYFPTGEVRWVHFRPAIGVLEIKEREYGISAIDQLVNKMEQLRASTWIAE